MNDLLQLGDVSGSFMIRIDGQSLSGEIIWENGIGHCPNSIGKKEMFNDLKSNGFKIIQFAYSSYGGCYFLEVIGRYSGKIEIVYLQENPLDFSWVV